MKKTQHNRQKKLGISADVYTLLWLFCVISYFQAHYIDNRHIFKRCLITIVKTKKKQKKQKQQRVLIKSIFQVSQQAT